MNFYSAVNGINAFCALIIALAILQSGSHKPLRFVAVILALLVCAWTFSNFVWSFQRDIRVFLIWTEILMFPVCYAHTAFFHFVLVLTNNNSKNYKKCLWFGYFISTVLAMINIRNGFVDSFPRPRPPFLWYAHASPLLKYFLAIEVLYVVLSFYILWAAIKKSDEPFKSHLRYFLIASVVGWLGAFTNWFYFYDWIPIPPIGNPALTAYLVAAAYLIFKYDFLGLNLAVEKTFIYTLLTLFIAMTYSLILIIAEKTFQRFIGYRSIVGSLIAGAAIAFLFNPLRDLSKKFIEKLFFGKGIVELSRENMKMKNELVKQDRLRSIATLSAGMAHEIKNPLTAIKVFAEFLPEKYNDPDFRNKFKTIVMGEVERINDILRQLLDFSKPQNPELRYIPIIPLLEEILHFMDGNLIKSHIEVVKQYDASPVVQIDKGQMKQVFLNVFLNSIQAMPEGGTLKVQTNVRNDNQLSIIISDTGIGISKKDLGHIFDPFFTTKEQGTGLGLSIVYGILEGHGGNVQIQSKAGKGTQVCITLKNAICKAEGSVLSPS